MATTKKVAQKKTTAKKPTAKSAPTAKRKTFAAKASKPQVQSFRASSDGTPFLTLAITRQTLYWGILSFIVLIMGLWIIHLQNEINKIYDAIEANQMQIDTRSYIIKKKAS